jgi:hypothetical protein
MLASNRQAAICRSLGFKEATISEAKEEMDKEDAS